MLKCENLPSTNSKFVCVHLKAVKIFAIRAHPDIFKLVHYEAYGQQADGWHVAGRFSCLSLTTQLFDCLETCDRVFPKCFTEFNEFSDKNISPYSKKAVTYHLTTSCSRDQNAMTASDRPVRDRIFQLSPIHALVLFLYSRNSQNLGKVLLIFENLHCFLTHFLSKICYSFYLTLSTNYHQHPITFVQKEKILYFNLF